MSIEIASVDGVNSMGKNSMSSPTDAPLKNAGTMLGVTFTAFTTLITVYAMAPVPIILKALMLLLDSSSGVPLLFQSSRSPPDLLVLPLCFANSVAKLTI